jgi:hypothetical protein
MSIATFESPQVASQRFFPWVSDEEADFGFSDTDSAEDFEAEAEVVCQQTATPTFAPVAGTRLGMPVRLGAVMLKLLKSYGITDEEIAEGVAAYAAKSGLAQAG